MQSKPTNPLQKVGRFFLRFFLRYIIGYVPKSERKKTTLAEGARVWSTRILVTALAISIIPLALGDYFFQYSVRSDTYITVGGTSIPNSVVVKEYNDFQRRYAAESIEKPWMIQLFYREIVKMARDMLFVNEANSLHIGTSKEILYGMIASTGEFQRADGSFNRTLFNRWVAENYAGVRAYLLVMGNNLKKEQLLGSIALELQPKNLEKDLESTIHQKRTIAYATIAINDMPYTEIPSDEQLLSYLEQNASRYKEPEYRGASLLFFDPNSIQSTVSEAEIQERYENNTAIYAEPVKRHIIHAFFETKEEANRAYAILKSNPESTAIDTIDLGFVAASDLPDDVARHAFKIPIGTVWAEPTETSLGYDVMRAVAQENPKILPLKTVRQEIIADIKQQKNDNQISNIISDIEDKIFLGVNFADIAKEVKGVRSVTIPPITKSQRMQNGLLMPSSLEVDKATVMLMYEGGSKTGTELQPFPQDKKLYYSLKITHIIPEKLPAFEEIKSTVQADFIMDQRRKKAYAKAIDMQRNIKTGKESINNYRPKTITMIRNMDDKGLPETLTSALFLNPLGMPIIGETPTGYHIAVALKAEAGKTPSKATLHKLGYTIAGTMVIRNSVMETYVIALEKKYPVKINQQRLMRALMPEEAQRDDSNNIRE